MIQIKKFNFFLFEFISKQLINSYEEWLIIDKGTQRRLESDKK